MVFALSRMSEGEQPAKPVSPAHSPTREPTGRVSLPPAKRVARRPAATPVRRVVKPAPARKARRRPAASRPSAATRKTVPIPVVRTPAPQPAGNFSQEFTP